MESTDGKSETRAGFRDCRCAFDPFESDGYDRIVAQEHVVIIGGGFGGIEAARGLRKAPVRVTLVDRRNHYLFQPLLYQVATAALSPGDIAWPIRSIFHSRPNVTVLMAEAEGIDSTARIVRTAQGSLPYDYLIVATGAAHSYFGHDEWAQFAPGLKNIDDALALRQRALLAFERAERTDSADERRKFMTTVIVGGGATGVEMAGAIAELDHRTLHGEFRRIDPGAARVVLVEAGPRVTTQNVDNFHFAGGFKGYFNMAGGEWDWDAGYNFNRQDKPERESNVVDLGNLAKALGPAYLPAGEKNIPSNYQCGTASDPVSNPTRFLSFAGDPTI